MLTENKVDHGDFPPAVVGSLERFLPSIRGDGVDIGAGVRGSTWEIPQEEIHKRRDLRDTRIFTIDPTTARDLDDALSVAVQPDGTIEVGVHIADVTYFVTPNSEVDKEAYRRGTSVYLVQQVSRKPGSCSS